MNRGFHAETSVTLLLLFLPLHILSVGIHTPPCMCAHTYTLNVNHPVTGNLVCLLKYIHNKNEFKGSKPVAKNRTLKITVELCEKKVDNGFK